MPVGHKDKLELVLFFKKQQTWEKLWKLSRLLFCKNIYVDKGNLHLKGCLLLCTRNTGQLCKYNLLFPGNNYQWRRQQFKDFNLYNNHNFVYCAFPVTSHPAHPHTHIETFFCLYLQMVFKWWIAPFQGVTQFPWVSSPSTVGMLWNLCLCPVNLFFFTGVPSQEPISVEIKLLFLLVTHIKMYPFLSVQFTEFWEMYILM